MPRGCPSWYWRELRPGSHGVDVMCLQIALGMDRRLCTGTYDMATTICVDALRTEHNLEPGIFDDHAAQLLGP